MGISNSSLTDRPYFKGISHLFAFIIYSMGFKSLNSIIPKDIKFSLTSYLLSEIGHFGASTLFHMIDWSSTQPEYLNYIRRLDHVMIFPKIVGTYHAVAATVLPDINPLVLRTVEVSAILGMISRILFTDAPKWVITIPYFITGWAILLNPQALITLYKRLPFGTLIAILGGILYTIGGCIYAVKAPNLFPGYFQYHELFHVFTILGTVCFTYFVFKHCIPYYVQSKLLI